MIIHVCRFCIPNIISFISITIFAPKVRNRYLRSLLKTNIHIKPMSNLLCPSFLNWIPFRIYKSKKKKVEKLGTVMLYSIRCWVYLDIEIVTVMSCLNLDSTMNHFIRKTNMNLIAVYIYILRKVYKFNYIMNFCQKHHKYNITSSYFFAITY